VGDRERESEMRQSLRELILGDILVEDILSRSSGSEIAML